MSSSTRGCGGNDDTLRAKNLTECLRWAMIHYVVVIDPRPGQIKLTPSVLENIICFRT